MRRTDYIEHIRRVPMLSACSVKELRLLSGLVDEVDISSGDVLVKEGTTGREFFTIISGKAKVTRKGREVAVLGPGDYFGELALLDPAPRDASVTAKTDMTVAILGAREFKGALAEVPTLASRIMAGMARRLRELDSR